MKKIFYLILVLVVCVLSACGSKHTHTANFEWKYDKNNHWHECSDIECAEFLDLSAHKYTWEKETEYPCKVVEVGTCECGYSTTRLRDDVSEHSWNEGESTVVNKCGATAVITYTCSTCGETKEETISHAHTGNWSPWVIETDATCKTEGSKSRTCLDCGEAVTEKINVDPDAHFYGVWTVIKVGNCTENGERQHVCQECHHVESEATEKVLDAHNLELVEIIEESTCKDKGSALYGCSRCDFEATKNLDYSSNHNFVSSNGVDNRCSVCSQINTETININNENVKAEDVYQLYFDGDFKVEYRFVNRGGDNEDGWHNWIFDINPADYIDGVLSSIVSDNFLLVQTRSLCSYWKDYGEYSYTPQITDINKSEFVAAMKDCDVVLIIERNESIIRASLTATTNVESVGQKVWKFEGEAPLWTKMVAVTLTSESSNLDIEKVILHSGNVASGSNNEVGKNQLTEKVVFENVGGRQHEGHSLTLASGDFDIVYNFTNKGNANNDWHNFYFNFYQCLNAKGNDSNAVWAFAANNNEPFYGYNPEPILRSVHTFGYFTRYVDNFAAAIANANIVLRITRINGRICAIGYAYTNDEAKTLICTYNFVSGKDFEKALTIRLSSENSKVTINQISLISGSVVTEHNYGEWHVEQEAVCGEDGLNVRICADCGKRDEKIIPATGQHALSEEWTNGEQVGCVLTQIKECQKCEYKAYREITSHSFTLNDSAGVTICEGCNELIEKTVVINNNGAVIQNCYNLYLTGDFDLTYKFNSTDGGNQNNWHNWCFVFLPATYENGKLVSIEVEKEPWGQSLASICSNGKFKAFIEEHNGKVESYIVDGVSVNNVEMGYDGILANGSWDVNVKRVGLKITVHAKMVSDQHEVSFVISFDMPTPLLCLGLSGENNQITLNSVVKNSGNFAETSSSKVGQELLTEAYTFVNSGSRLHNGYTVSMAEGDFDVEYQFINNGGSGSDWHNFYYNFYAGVTSTGLDSDNVLWAIAANNNEPDWNYTFASNNLRGTTGRAGFGWNYKYADITSMTNATCYVRITRIDGVISVTGHAYNESGAMITSFCFVGAGTFDNSISMRLMSENSSVTINSIKLYNGVLA